MWLDSSRHATLLVFLAALFSMSGCFFKKTRTTASSLAQTSLVEERSDDLPPELTPGLTPVQRSAYSVFKRSCNTCHSQWSAYLTDADWVNSGLVKARDVRGSVIDSRIKFGNGAQNMPAVPEMFAVFTRADYDAIATWISAIDLSSPPPPVPPPVDDGSDSNREIARVSDRKQLYTQFMSVFGPTAHALATDLILNRLSLFGGPCDPMLETVPGICTADVYDVKAPLTPSSSSVREGQRMKACNAMAAQDGMIQNVIRSATARTDLAYLVATPVPSDSDIEQAFDLFYPGQAPTAAILASLRRVAVGAVESGKSLEAWRYLILTLCHAADWQSL